MTLALLGGKEHRPFISEEGKSETYRKGWTWSTPQRSHLSQLYLSWEMHRNLKIQQYISEALYLGFNSSKNRPASLQQNSLAFVTIQGRNTIHNETIRELKTALCSVQECNVFYRKCTPITRVKVIATFKFSPHLISCHIKCFFFCRTKTVIHKLKSNWSLRWDSSKSALLKLGKCHSELQELNQVSSGKIPWALTTWKHLKLPFKF